MSLLDNSPAIYNCFKLFLSVSAVSILEMITHRFLVWGAAVAEYIATHVTLTHWLFIPGVSWGESSFKIPTT